MSAYGSNRFDELVGKTFVSITGAEPQSDEIVFTCTDGSVYRMHHMQDCCESVTVEEVIGDPSKLIGDPILYAEESSNGDDLPVGVYNESFTWTFYRLATVNGHLVIRWYGSSNGYYSEDVDFVLKR